MGGGGEKHQTCQEPELTWALPCASRAIHRLESKASKPALPAMNGSGGTGERLPGTGSCSMLCFAPTVVRRKGTGTLCASRSPSSQTSSPVCALIAARCLKRVSDVSGGRGTWLCACQHCSKVSPVGISVDQARE